MGGRDAGQEWLDSYRYQLAFGAYTWLMAAHYYLPAAPGAMRPVVDALISKMCRRDVWGYWYETSRSGPLLDPSISSDADLLPPERDPVVGNVMWSGHLATMVTWRDLVLGEEHYDLPGARPPELRRRPAFLRCRPSRRAAPAHTVGVQGAVCRARGQIGVLPEPADSRLPVDDAQRDPALPQRSRGGQPGEPGADDAHLGVSAHRAAAASSVAIRCGVTVAEVACRLVRYSPVRSST